MEHSEEFDGVFSIDKSQALKDGAKAKMHTWAKNAKQKRAPNRSSIYASK